MYDKGNYVLFTVVDCTMTNVISRSLVLKGKRHKTVYKVSIVYPLEFELTCLSVMIVSLLL